MTAGSSPTRLATSSPGSHRAERSVTGRTSACAGAAGAGISIGRTPITKATALHLRITTTSGRRCRGARIKRLTAYAGLDDPAPELARARQALDDGDPDWGEWIAQFERGEALILRLRLEVAFEIDGRGDRLEVADDGVWVENDAHPPVVEQQVRDAITNDLDAVSHGLAQAGIAVSAAQLDRMLIHVELEDALRGALGCRRDADRPHLRPSDDG